MARAKTSKSATNKKNTLKPEKEQSIPVKELIRDERTRKIAGAFMLLIGFMLLISFVSYLFTWDKDQSLVLSMGKSILWGTDAEFSNQLGSLGAYLSHFFIYRGFGVASFLIPTFFFVVGINWFLGKQVFSAARNIRYVLVGLVFFSVAFALVFAHSRFAWGGAVGSMARNWLVHTIGLVGSYAAVGLALLSYFIWQFNPNFNKPVESATELLNRRKGASSTEEPDAEGFSISNEQESVVPVGNSVSEGNGSAQARETLQVETPLHDMQLVEKNGNVKPVENEELNGQPVSSESGPSKQSGKKAGKADPLVLEIKEAPETDTAAPEEPAPRIGSLETAYDPILDLRDYKYPHLDLLETHGSEKIIQDADELEANKTQIINTLRNYDIEIQKITATVGPTVTLYEIIPAAGIRISRIKNLEDDIALSLAALGIRIIAPIPGKGTIGIEVPNARKTIVSMRTLLAADKFQKNNFSLPIALGKKIDNENFIVDLANMPHLLMAGATGQGKSVGLNAILVSLLFKKHPSQLKFVLVDPKKVELSIYKTIEKHFLAKLPGEEDAIITDTRKVVHTLNALCIEMDNRYDLLKEAGCRNIREYNEKFAARKLNPEKGHQFLPFIVLVVDEFADLIMTAGKEVEMPIARLAQLARAVGVHLIIATQRPSVNIITGTIKANFPARIAFKVSSKIDSRTILDVGGAEQLIGKGDMLISYNGELVRLQCAFVDTPEVDKVNEYIGDQRGYTQAFMLPEYVDEKEMEKGEFDINDKDPLFEDAARLIVSAQSGSTSLLQRRMKLGYNRAGRLMDQLESAGVVGPNLGSKVRDVLFKTEAELQQYLDNM
jgi:S-DNA-T family DNA segregation ATPase FtsK/SpoIIIE